MTDLEVMAARADRSMRTFAARTIAETVYEKLGEAASADALLHTLGTVRSWTRVDEDHFTCAFGDRNVTITVPTPFHASAMLRLVVRTEVNVCLGDADPALLVELHAIAQRELERLNQ
ncbi:MAG TPA: hypothetical protein VFP80_06325 [Thermoanaerobaculia bacterium]|nr:hypothetical protein [Thermoanaerobaculia bacterium]